MSKQNSVSALYIVAAAVLPYLLSQSDVTISPIVKVVLTALNIAVVALARFSNPQNEPVNVAIVPPAPNPEEPKP